MLDSVRERQARLLRTAKGKKPQYFQDPAVDKLLAMVLTLTQELSVTRDRVDTLERLIEQHGLFDQADVDCYELPEEAMFARSQSRSAYIARVLKAIQDEADALTAGAGEGQNVPDPPEE